VLVSAVKSVDDGTVYVQIKPGDAAYDVVAGPKNSGLEISDAFGRHVGDRLNIYGTLSLTASGWVLGAETIEVISTLNEATSLASITFTAFDTNRPAFDGALLDLPSITIASIDSAGWHLTGTSLIVDKTLIGTLPAAEVGQNISTLRGIGESYGSDFKVMPRTASDIVLDPVGCSLPGIESIEAPTTDC
jgi:hypothetical protein